jgi:integrase
VPSCPELTEILWWHIERFGTGPDGLLFRGVRNNGRIGSSTYGRIWAKAREAVFVPEVASSLLVKRPYDLRHACVSTWLVAGVEPTRVAAWAGHSVAVLMKVYAKFLDGGEQAARVKVERLLMPEMPKRE